MNLFSFILLVDCTAFYSGRKCLSVYNTSEVGMIEMGGFYGEYTKVSCKAGRNIESAGYINHTKPNESEH